MHVAKHCECSCESKRQICLLKRCDTTPQCGVLQAVRSYLHVRDVARAFDIVLHKGIVGQTYNIGTQKERSVNEVAAAIAAHFQLGKGCIQHVPDRAFNDQRCVRTARTSQLYILQLSVVHV